MVNQLKNFLNLEEIRFEREISPEEYKDLSAGIGMNGKRRGKGDGIYAKITKTLQYDNYEDIFNQFRGHSLAREACVMNNGVWERSHPLQLYNKKIERFAEIARKDKRKRGYFELKFEENNLEDSFNGLVETSRPYHHKDKFKIGFGEVDANITAIEIVFPMYLIRVINVDLGKDIKRAINEEAEHNAESHLKNIFGVWVPEKHIK